METKEFEFKGMVFNGFLMLFVNLLLTIVSMTGIVFSFLLLGGTDADCRCHYVVWSPAVGTQRGARGNLVW